MLIQIEEVFSCFIFSFMFLFFFVCLYVCLWASMWNLNSTNFWIQYWLHCVCLNVLVCVLDYVHINASSCFTELCCCFFSYPCWSMAIVLTGKYAYQLPFLCIIFWNGKIWWENTICSGSIFHFFPFSVCISFKFATLPVTGTLFYS